MQVTLRPSSHSFCLLRLYKNCFQYFKLKLGVQSSEYTECVLPIRYTDAYLLGVP